MAPHRPNPRLSPAFFEVHAILERPWLTDAALLEGIANDGHERADLLDPFARGSGLLLATRLGYLVIPRHDVGCGVGGLIPRVLLVRASAEILASVGDVTKRVKMLEHGRKIKALEEEGDVLYAQSVGALFEHDEPAIEVLKWKEIYDSLEEAIDECEDVSNVLESIALKNS